MITVSSIKTILDNSLGKGAWGDYEAETLASESGIPFSELLFDKVSILRVMEHYPELFFTDVLFMIYATSVFNDEGADFEHLPHITSLEMALAITEMAIILNKPVNELPLFGIGNSLYIRHLLLEEGYSEAPAPFDIVGIKDLPKGQTEQDTKDKELAIRGYLYAVYNK